VATGAQPAGAGVTPGAQPSVVPPPAGAADPLQELARKASERYAGIDSYIARLKRKEQVNGKDEPEEVLLVKFRKQPWSIYFKWLGPERKGREATYVKGMYESKLHTLLASGDMPLMPAGKKIALDPDGMLVRNRSRHHITSAGIGHLVDQFSGLVQTRDPNGRVQVRYLGAQKRPEYETPLEGIEQTIPPGSEEAMLGGGRRFIYFDPTNGLPVLVTTYDKNGHQVEYYCWDRIQFPVKLDNKDFDPEQMGKQ